MQHSTTICLVIILLDFILASRSPAGELQHIQVAKEGKSFVFAESGKPFVPWGVNYDHDGEGRLIEDYWHDEWATVLEDFEEIKALGANVVRVHLQFGKFMVASDRPNDRELKRLARLVSLAEEKQLYLDVTGLGCYHKDDVPAWYDELDEGERWQAQANFWEAVAKTCADSPAIFCYDLMNEPVVPGGDKKNQPWLGPAFASKHFVQRISQDRDGRERPDIAAAWIKTLVAAIKKHDQRHMITVGLVPWSLDRKGLTSGFVPEKIHAELDFIAMHIYPESGKLDEALETVKGFDVGKPIVIEETFPLKCRPEELVTFIERTKPHAAGWISFYWGEHVAELREQKTLIAAIKAKWFNEFEKLGREIRE